jgi:hypothetical protein
MVLLNFGVGVSAGRGCGVRLGSRFGRYGDVVSSVERGRACEGEVTAVVVGS